MSPRISQRDFWSFVATIAIGISVTVVAVPFLIVATCVPATVTGHFDAMENILNGEFLIYAGVAACGSTLIAVMTRNQGVRWGNIVLFCMAVAAMIWLVVPGLR